MFPSTIMVAQITLVMETTDPTDRSTPPSRMMYICAKVSRIMPILRVKRLRRFRVVRKYGLAKEPKMTIAIKNKKANRTSLLRCSR